MSWHDAAWFVGGVVSVVVLVAFFVIVLALLCGAMGYYVDSNRP